MGPHDPAPPPPTPPAEAPPIAPIPPAGTPADRPGVIRWRALAAGAAAALLSWLLIEATYGTIRPKTAPRRMFGSTFLIAGAQERADAVAWNAALAFGLTGAAAGLALGLAGGLARGPARGAAAAVGGLVLAAAAGAGTSLAALPLATALHERDPGNMSLEMASSLLAHGAAWGAIGAAGGLAFGIGLGGRGRGARALTGGVVGGLAGALLYELVGALALPGTRTLDPVATTAGVRLLAQVSAVIPAALGVAALAPAPARKSVRLSA